MRMKREYPKMIYKGGVVNQVAGEYCVVHSYDEHMEMLEIWGDKRPERILKKDDLLVKPKEIKEDKGKESVAADSEKAEEKPRRKKTRRKASRKS